jgi:hypothetical protein
MHKFIFPIIIIIIIIIIIHSPFIFAMPCVLLFLMTLIKKHRTKNKFLFHRSRSWIIFLFKI